MALFEQEIEELFDVLTGYHITSYEDISNVTGWSVPTVGAVLATVRRPDVALQWGWTVPHVPRGRGEHLYQVVLLDGSQKLTADAEAAVRAGGKSTLEHIATMGENEALALRTAAANLSATIARRLRRIAVVMESAAAQARDLLESNSL